MFKKLSFVAFFAASLLFLTSCGGGAANTPDAVAKAFLEEIGDQDFSGAKKYATKSSASMLDMMESTMALAGDAVPEMDVDIKILKTDEDGDKATVTYNDGEKEDKLKLVKEEGEWKVAFGKGDMEDDTPAIDDEGDDVIDQDMDMGAVTDSLNAAFEELGDALKDLGEELGTDKE